MNNVIALLEQRALAALPIKTPCNKCGKPISNKGKRMHDMYCYSKS